MTPALRLSYISSLAIALAAGAGTASAQTQPLPEAPPTEEEGPELPEDFEGMEIEELLSVPVSVWSATKTETRVEEAPAAVTVISGEDLRRWGYRSVADVLRWIVGFYVLDDYILPNVASRGVSGGLYSESGLIKVMIDGQPTSFRSTAGNWLGPEFLPLSAIERIEVIRGPSSALYGADAFLGVINVTTRSPGRLAGGDLSFASILPSSSGSLGYGADLAVGTRRGPFEVIVSYRTESVDHSGLLLPASSPAPVIPAYKFDNRQTTGMVLESSVAYAKASYHFSRATRLTISGLRSAIDRVAEFSPTTQLSRGFDASGRFNETRVALAQYNAGLKLETAFTNSLNFNLDLTYFQGGPTDEDRTEVGSNLFWVRRRFGYLGTDSTAQLSWTASPRLTLLGGLGFILDREQLPTTERVLKARTGALEAGAITGSTPSVNRNLVNPGVYLQAMWTAVPTYLRLTGAVRLDRHNIYGNQLSARLAAVSEVLHDTFLKLIYGSSFKAPSPFLLYATPYYVGGIIGNPDLEPQYIHTVETQISHQRRHLSLSSSVALSVVRDKAEFTQQGLNKVARNFSSSSALSWENSLDVRYQDRLGGFLRAELVAARRDPGQEGYVSALVGHAPVIYPRFIGRAGVMAQLPVVPVRASVQALSVSGRRASDTNILERGAPYTLDPYLLLNASLASTRLRLFRLHETVLMLSGYNLLRASGPDPGFAGIDYPLAPRTWLFELRQRL
jgi:outer membrane receptor for ferrienterochelin and colicins